MLQMAGVPSVGARYKQTTTNNEVGAGLRRPNNQRQNQIPITTSDFGRAILAVLRDPKDALLPPASFTALANLTVPPS